MRATNAHYEHYRKRGGELDKPTWLRLVKATNKEIARRIIDLGEILNLGSYLSTLSVVRVERDFHKPTPDWKASYAERDRLLEQGLSPKGPGNPDGEEWMVFRTDDEFCRFRWRKSACLVKNRGYYSFRPARGKTGMKTRLIARLTADDTAYLTYAKL